ncbi:MAG: hypothetical protein K1W23_11550 [Lachnospiraceae bacterium]|jgi:hypothetical protein
MEKYFGILSAILLSGCGKESVPEGGSPIHIGSEKIIVEKDSMPESINFLAFFLMII